MARSALQQERHGVPPANSSTRRRGCAFQRCPRPTTLFTWAILTISARSALASSGTIGDLSKGQIVGVVLGSVFGALALVGAAACVWCMCAARRRQTRDLTWVKSDDVEAAAAFEAAYPHAPAPDPPPPAGGTNTEGRDVLPPLPVAVSAGDGLSPPASPPAASGAAAAGSPSTGSVVKPASARFRAPASSMRRALRGVTLRKAVSAPRWGWPAGLKEKHLMVSPSTRVDPSAEVELAVPFEPAETNHGPPLSKSSMLLRWLAGAEPPADDVAERLAAAVAAAGGRPSGAGGGGKPRTNPFSDTLPLLSLAAQSGIVFSRMPPSAASTPAVSVTDGSMTRFMLKGTLRRSDGPDDPAGAGPGDEGGHLYPASLGRASVESLSHAYRPSQRTGIAFDRLAVTPAPSRGGSVGGAALPMPPSLPAAAATAAAAAADAAAAGGGVRSAVGGRVSGMEDGGFLENGASGAGGAGEPTRGSINLARVSFGQGLTRPPLEGEVKGLGAPGAVHAVEVAASAGGPPRHEPQQQPAGHAAASGFEALAPPEPSPWLRMLHELPPAQLATLQEADNEAEGEAEPEAELQPAQSSAPAELDLSPSAQLQAEEALQWPVAAVAPPPPQPDALHHRPLPGAGPPPLAAQPAALGAAAAGSVLTEGEGRAALDGAVSASEAAAAAASWQRFDSADGRGPAPGRLSIPQVDLPDTAFASPAAAAAVMASAAAPSPPAAHPAAAAAPAALSGVPSGGGPHTPSRFAPPDHSPIHTPSSSAGAGYLGAPRLSTLQRPHASPTVPGQGALSSARSMSTADAGSVVSSPSLGMHFPPLSPGVGPMVLGGAGDGTPGGEGGALAGGGDAV